MNGERKISVEVVGNAYVLQLLIDADGIIEERGKPVVVLDEAEDAELGKAVRDLFRTRVRTPRTKAPADAGGAS